MTTQENHQAIGWTTGLGLLGLSIIFLLMWGCPTYNVWQQGLAGKAKLERADQERKILVSRARVELEASELQAQAIEIVGKVAKKYPEYRHQEFMGAFSDAINNENSPIKLILVPTEGNIPIILNTED